VAENGAVLAFPGTGKALVLDAPPPDVFLDELARRKVRFARGECVVEAAAGDAGPVLDIVRGRELPLALLFNRSRLMVLPQGVSKATGLREALTALRLSEHNALAIGDAENDHAMLEAAEVGVAVGWGSPALRAVADEVVEGGGPAALIPYLDRLGASPFLPLPRVARRHLILGQDADGRPVQLAIRGRNVLVVGDPRSGKSWIAGLLAEQLVLRRYCLCVIDPEGDYRALETLPRVSVVGGAEPPPPPHEIAHLLRHPDIGLVIDLSELELGRKRDYARELLPQLAALRRQTGLPHRIVLDEAHYFLHDAAGRAALDFELAGYTLVTYRVSELHPAVRAASDVVLATRLTDPVEVAAVAALADPRGEDPAWAAALGHLRPGEAVILGGDERPPGGPRPFVAAPRLAPHVRHRQKYLNVRLPEPEAFVFTRDGAPTGERARTLGELVASIGRCDPDVLEGHLRRGDVSRWIADVFGDFSLAAQVRRIEQLRRLGQALDARDALAQLVAERYLLDEALA
jgi:hypothetical protein